MVSNDIVMPFVLKRRAAGSGGPSDAGAQLLTVRRIAIFAILFLAYIYYRSAGPAQLASIGLLSFRRHRPADAGLFRRTGLAARYGAGRDRRYDCRHSGLGLYALAAEHLRRRRRRATSSIAGPLGLAWLRPQALFGLDLPPLVHGVVLSLRRQCHSLCRLLACPAADRNRARASGCVRSVLARPDGAELPAAAFVGYDRRS